VGGGKEKEIYVLFRMKVLTKFSLLKREYNPLRADPVHLIVHWLLVAGFSLRRWLVLNIFRLINSCIHQLSRDLLIGSVGFLIPASVPCTSLFRAKMLGPEQYMVQHSRRRSCSYSPP
jgi:hypothetical protein